MLESLLFHVNDDIVWPTSKELFRRFVVGIFLDVPGIGWNKEIVTWASLYKFFEILTVIDTDVA